MPRVRYTPDRVVPAPPTPQTPTARWTEELPIADQQNVLLLRQSDDFTLDDLMHVKIVGLQDTFAAADQLAPTVSAPYVDTFGVADSVVATIDGAAFPRSATPDADFQVDAYTDQTNPAANFGNTGDLLIQPPVAGANQKRAYLLYDLRAFAGWTAVASAVLTLHLQHNQATAQSISAGIYHSAAAPFVESTATWNAPPTLGTLAASVLPPGTPIAAGASYSSVPFIIGNLALTACLGRYMLVYFTRTALEAGNFQLASREHATAAFRPSLYMKIRRG